MRKLPSTVFMSVHRNPPIIMRVKGNFSNLDSSIFGSHPSLQSIIDRQLTNLLSLPGNPGVLNEELFISEREISSEYDIIVHCLFLNFL